MPFGDLGQGHRAFGGRPIPTFDALPPAPMRVRVRRADRAMRRLARTVARRARARRPLNRATLIECPEPADSLGAPATWRARPIVPGPLPSLSPASTVTRCQSSASAAFRTFNCLVDPPPSGAAPRVALSKREALLRAPRRNGGRAAPTGQVVAERGSWLPRDIRRLRGRAPAPISRGHRVTANPASAHPISGGASLPGPPAGARRARPESEAEPRPHPR